MITQKFSALALAGVATLVMAIHIFVFVPAPSFLELVLVVASVGVCVILVLEGLNLNNSATAKTGLYLFVGVCLCLTLLFAGSSLTATTEQLHHIAALIERDEKFREFFYQSYGHRGMVSMLDAWRLQAFAAYDAREWQNAVEAFVNAKNEFR